MKPRFEVSAAARADIRDASHWYRETSRELERRFLDEVGRVFGRMATRPQQFRQVVRGVRSASLLGFPYNILFRERANLLTVIACFHTSRDPVILQSRT